MFLLFFFQYIYRDRVNSIIDNHTANGPNETPLFVYLALQSVHYPVEVSEIKINEIN